MSKQRQVLGINFTVRFRGVKATDILFLDGEPLGPDQSTEPKEQALSGQLEFNSPEGLQGITQYSIGGLRRSRASKRSGLASIRSASTRIGLKQADVFKAPVAKAAGPGRRSPVRPHGAGETAGRHCAESGGRRRVAKRQRVHGRGLAAGPVYGANDLRSPNAGRDGTDRRPNQYPGRVDGVRELEAPRSNYAVALCSIL